MKQLNIKLVKQKGNKNCWAACLSMALQVFDIQKTEKELCNLFGEDNGMSLDDLHIQLPKQFPDLHSTYQSELDAQNPNPILSFEQIKECIDNGLPILIGVYQYNGLLAHALLIYGYDESNNNVILADPWTGQEVIMDYKNLTQNVFWVETLIITQ
ncbi:MAG: C39 family peptidase [Raineya sp.]|jgi:ABC-type bacteriocin/lantibiotic exporter with double-glycine peptidase domain|nr:C39 family peptidase [Raineya sp.]